MGAQRWSKAKRQAVLPQWSQTLGIILVVVFVAWLGYALLFPSKSATTAPTSVPATATTAPLTKGSGLPTTTGTGPATTGPAVSMVTVQHAVGAGSSQVPEGAVAVAKQAAVAEASGVWTGVPLASGTKQPAPPASPYAPAATSNVTLVSGTGSPYVFFVTTTVSPTASGDIQVGVRAQGSSWVFDPTLSTLGSS